MLEWLGNHNDEWLKEKLRYLSSFLASKKNSTSCNAQKKIAQDMPSGLSLLGRDLEAISEGVEPEFIRIGHDLQVIYGDATGLTQHVLDSVNLIGGKEGEGVLFQLRGLAEESMAELERCQKDISWKTARIKTVLEHLGSLSGIFPLIEKIGLLLKVVAVNIGIESARSNESTELFSVVAQETGNLSMKIKSISEGSLDVLKSAQDKQKSLYGNLVEGLKEINRLGKNARGIVRDAVREIENLMASTLQVAEQAGEHSRRISQQVGDLVVAVQFHDSMSQRVEHITKALGDAEGFLAEVASSERDVDYNKNLSHAFSLIRLQTAQLKDIVAEIERVHEKGVQSFDVIINEFSALLNQLSDLNESPGQNPDRERQTVDPFNRLRSSFGNLNGVLQQGQALMDPVRHAASRVSDTVDKVSGLVQNIHTIGFETHLMALNAIVNAARLGQEGGALEVLAQEVKQASDRSTSILRRTDELLNLVTGVADRLRNQNATGEVAVSLDGSMEEISRAYNRFIESSAVALERADEIKCAISETKARLDFLPILAERLTVSLKRFETMTQDLSSFAVEGHKMSQEEMEDMLGRYTMEKEREIHGASLYGSSELPFAGDIAEVLPEADDDGAGQAQRVMSEDRPKSDIEIFEDGAPFQENESGGDFILFGPPEAEEKREAGAETSEPEEASENEGDLGDNVELF